MIPRHILDSLYSLLSHLCIVALTSFYVSGYRIRQNQPLSSFGKPIALFLLRNTSNLAASTTSFAGYREIILWFSTKPTANAMSHADCRRLEGRVGIVTGAASGIGEATARLFAAQGARVIVADIQDELGKRVAESIGPSASYVHCDVTKEEDVRALVDAALEKHGRLDIMYSNAGILGRHGSVAEMDLHDFDHVMATNVRGAAAAIKHAARAMVPAKKGSIICTASIAASVAGPTMHAYCVSKHAVVGLVRTAASELGRHGIRVNCVSPFAVPTPLLFDAWRAFGRDPQNAEADCSAIANLQGVVVKADDVANAVLFLASDEAAYVSGHNLAVDGGFAVVNHSMEMYK